MFCFFVFFFCANEKTRNRQRGFAGSKTFLFYFIFYFFLFFIFYFFYFLFFIFLFFVFVFFLFFCFFFLFLTVVIWQRIGGMSAADMLRRQKQGLMVRLGELRREVANEQRKNILLAKSCSEAESLVSAFRQMWILLEGNLSMFAQRTNAQKQPNVDSHLIRFLKSVSIGSDFKSQSSISANSNKSESESKSDSKLDSSDLSSELAQKVEWTKRVLEQIAAHLYTSEKSANVAGFDEAQVKPC